MRHMSECEDECEARWLVADLRAWRTPAERSIEMAQETIRATREAIDYLDKPVGLSVVQRTLPTGFWLQLR